MLILHIIASMNPADGGVCQAVSTLVDGLMSQGVDSEILCLDLESSPFLSEVTSSVTAFGPMKGPWAFAWGVFSWLVANLCRFDAVIVHGLWLYPSFVTRKAMKALAVRNESAPKWFVMPHGMLDPYFQRDPSRRFKAIRNRIYWRLVERRVINDSTGLLFTCEQEMFLARDTFPGYSPRGQDVVGMGVPEPASISTTQRNQFEDISTLLGIRPYILFLGRIHPKKGVDNLLRAYVKVAIATGASLNNFPSLLVVGPLSSAYAEEMQVLSKVLTSSAPKTFGSFGPRIIFSGMLQGVMKWCAFDGCEAFVLASHQENFGIAVVEAMANSKPVLISREVNIYREIESDGAGFCEDDTLDGTVRLLERWLKVGPKDRARMGKRARQCYLNHFQVEKAAKNFLSAIGQD